MNKYITKVKISASPVNDIEAQPISRVKDLSLSDIMLDYIQGQYTIVDEAYEAFSDELNRRIYEAISQYQPPSQPSDSLGNILMFDSLQGLINSIGDLRY